MTHSTKKMSIPFLCVYFSGDLIDWLCLYNLWQKFCKNENQNNQDKSRDFKIIKYDETIIKYYSRA